MGEDAKIYIYHKAKVGGLVLLCFFVAGCQKGIQSITDITENLTGKVQLEQKKQAEKTLATIKCQEFCQNKMTTGDQDFNKGPCLSEQIIPGWACDIAHVPRQEVDDEADNQCSSFRTGTAQNLIEIDGNCNLIKLY